MQNDTYTLKVEIDEYPLNPRTDYDNLGKMVCWHSRYYLGDQHSFNEPVDFLKQLVSETLTADEVIDFVKDGGCDSVKLEYNSNADTYTLKDIDAYSGDWFYGYTFDGDELGDSDLAKDAILEVLPIDDLKELADKHNVILPLYLYDHSGITISCGHSYPYNDRWDAGQVGWIYASHDNIRQEYGALNSATIEKARQTLISETNTYDSYIRGECYGYTIDKNGKALDSCWGFIGDFKDVIEDMKSYADEDYRQFFDKLDYSKMSYSGTISADKEERAKPSIREQLSALKSQAVNITSHSEKHIIPEL